MLFHSSRDSVRVGHDSPITPSSHSGNGVLQDLQSTIKEAIAIWKRKRWLRRQRASIPDPFTTH